MSESNLKITYIGHATVLIQRGPQAFLTDPNFSHRIGWRRNRLQPPGISPYRLPPLTALLVSQASFAHLDLFSFKYFKTSVEIVVPKGLGKLVRRFLPNPVTELEPGGSHQLGEVLLHATPILKKGHRWNPFRHRAATGFILESPGFNLYFAGDTGYGDHFEKTGRDFSIDLALLPIQARKTPSSGPKSSLSPAKALQAGQDLGAQWIIPIAWDAFSLGKKNPEASLSEFRELAKQSGLEERIRILNPGESINF